MIFFSLNFFFHIICKIIFYFKKFITLFVCYSLKTIYKNKNKELFLFFSLEKCISNPEIFCFSH